ncbi:MAG: leucyl aminopeptidase [Gammaproteobacteria bacterium]|jgi:leucyl aminopeptidase|nr:leucyl aminopeptidase [Gammaproteobacteria bacterium]MBT4462990.1 leucyl aminopeptidase [Gammaproteobacteria bacterium]MBT4654587.1 leucyl aminopeptidase [Gammaproteobacteria bacterium]MBT5117125.1 leucyl aminopeptidase [Gammaproteobacteria bacterium]MBT5761273.1 leucyl aminopeptidase [Gammaproteobacteria bacterium]
MDYKSLISGKLKGNTDIYLIGVFADKKLTHLNKSVSEITLKLIKKCIDDNNFTGDIGDNRTFDDLENKFQITLFGLGTKEKFGPISFSRSISLIIKKIEMTNAKSLSLNIDNIISNKLAISAEFIVSSIENSFYKYSHKKDKVVSKIKECNFISKNAISSKSFNKSVSIGKAIASGIGLAKDLGNTPPNICTPTYLSAEAIKLKKINKLIKITVLNEAKMKSLGMGSLLSVSQGSKQPAKLVSIEYMPLKNKAPIVLVGKGITFDTGGISLKPSPNMDEMKFDMSGAGSVIGTMKAVAEMNIKTNVVGIIACAENMPGSQATRPGDVVTSMSGITIEILNTDAEGRLVLCDALTYAKKYKPRYMLDMATLTGACLVGLGKYPSGLFSNSEKLAGLIKKSADKTGDRVWQLPLYDDYFKELKTNFADIQNIGGRYGGAITAAAFLAKFTEGIDWAHLDIAGTAWEVGENKGSTGRPVSLLIDFILSNQ